MLTKPRNNKWKWKNYIEIVNQIFSLPEKMLPKYKKEIISVQEETRGVVKNIVEERYNKGHWDRYLTRSEKFLISKIFLKYLERMEFIESASLKDNMNCDELNDMLRITGKSYSPMMKPIERILLVAFEQTRKPGFSLKIHLVDGSILDMVFFNWCFDVVLKSHRQFESADRNSFVFSYTPTKRGNNYSSEFGFGRKWYKKRPFTPWFSERTKDLQLVNKFYGDKSLLDTYIYKDIGIFRKFQERNSQILAETYSDAKWIDQKNNRITKISHWSKGIENAKRNGDKEFWENSVKHADSPAWVHTRRDGTIKGIICKNVHTTTEQKVLTHTRIKFLYKNGGKKFIKKSIVPDMNFDVYKTEASIDGNEFSKSVLFAKANKIVCENVAEVLYFVDLFLKLKIKNKL